MVKKMEKTVKSTDTKAAVMAMDKNVMAGLRQQLTQRQTDLLEYKSYVIISESGLVIARTHPINGFGKNPTRTHDNTIKQAINKGVMDVKTIYMINYLSLTDITNVINAFYNNNIHSFFFNFSDVEYGIKYLGAGASKRTFKIYNMKNPAISFVIKYNYDNSFKQCNQEYRVTTALTYEGLDASIAYIYRYIKCTKNGTQQKNVKGEENDIISDGILIAEYCRNVDDMRDVDEDSRKKLCTISHDYKKDNIGYSEINKQYVYRDVGACLNATASQAIEKYSRFIK